MTETLLLGSIISLQCTVDFPLILSPCFLFIFQIKHTARVLKLKASFFFFQAAPAFLEKAGQKNP